MKKNNSLYIGIGILGLLVLFAGVLALVVGFGIYFWRNPESAAIKDIDPNQPPIPFRKGDKWGFSDKNKKLIIDAKYDEALQFIEGLAAIKLNDKWGIIDKTGKQVIPLKYEHDYGREFRFY